MSDNRKLSVPENRSRRIAVTQSDIERGCASDSENCPIALAATRTFGEAVGVGGEAMTIPPAIGTGAKLRFRAELPDRARDFILDYDAGLRVAPLTFYVTLEAILV